jgi:homoserine O-acetyltransferase
MPPAVQTPTTALFFLRRRAPSACFRRSGSRTFGHGESSKPSDGLHAHFPHYGYRDMIDLQHHVVHDVIGIQRLHAILGMSMGGMHAWQWAEAHPDEVRGSMPVVSLPMRIAG